MRLPLAIFRWLLLLKKSVWHGDCFLGIGFNGKSSEKKMMVQVLSQVPGARIAKMMAGFCPFSRFCLARVLFWAVVNIGGIAPVMT